MSSDIFKSYANAALVNQERQAAADLEARSKKDIVRATAKREIEKNKNGNEFASFNRQTYALMKDEREEKDNLPLEEDSNVPARPVNRLNRLMGNKPFDNDVEVIIKSKQGDDVREISIRLSELNENYQIAGKNAISQVEEAISTIISVYGAPDDIARELFDSQVIEREVVVAVRNEVFSE